MNIRYPITIIFLLLSFSMIAQREIIYDLNNYKQVSFKRSALTLTPSGGLSGKDNVNVEGVDADFLFKFGSLASHSKYINNEDQQYSLTQRIRFNIADGIEISANRNMTKRSYNNNRYLKLGYRTDGTFDSRRNQITNINNDQKELQFEGDFGVGFGRIEYINHAWSAIQILQALEENNLLLRFPSHDEITNFANLIGTVRTNRILDFRLRNIEILETTVNYLIEEKFVDNLSTLAILIIGDTYQYDQIINRNAGSRLEFTLAPGVEYLNTNNSNSFFPNKTFLLQTIGKIDHVSYNNIDVKWMKTRSYGSILEFTNLYEFYESPQIENITLRNATAGLTYSYGFRYLPNLRNNFRLNLQSGLFMDAMFRENAPTSFSSARMSINLQSEFNHYFSPYTQLFIIGILNYNDAEFQKGEFQPAISGSLNFGLTHAIF